MESPETIVRFHPSLFLDTVRMASFLGRHIVDVCFAQVFFFKSIGQHFMAHLMDMVS